MTSPGTILVVDDNLLNRILLSTSLQEDGYTVEMAEDGRQALEMLGAQPFDVVLLDLLMPEMDGYQVLEQIKANSAWRTIPVIIVSSLDEMESILRCIEMGATDYLPKPFDAALLHARIGASLASKRLHDMELEYIEQVGHVTRAAAAVEAGTFELDSLNPVAMRQDSLGQLARVFQNMARQVYAREQSLRQQVQELRVEIDEVKKARQVAEITETEYFRDLCAKAQRLRQRRDK
ncbi:MAG: response regulator [Anaerolineae bacterium]|nr:response regulator [Anaerolineae bacterium]